MKLCKDCKYYKASKASDSRNEYSRCSHPENSSVVDGGNYVYCSSSRNYDGYCGVSAKGFVDIKEEELFKVDVVEGYVEVKEDFEGLKKGLGMDDSELESYLNPKPKNVPFWKRWFR